MVETSNITNVLRSYLLNGTIWIGLTIVLAIACFLIFGYLTRRSKLKYSCIEIVRFGNGKVGLNLMKAGYFRLKKFLFFFDKGSERYIKTSDGRVIEKARTSHLHDIFGKKGFICYRSNQDPKILVPISRIELANEELVFEIAPADYREASVRIFNESVEETKGTLEKLLPYIAIGLCILLCIVTIVICMQMTNNAVEKVGKILASGCSNTAQAIQSTTAP